MNITLTEILLFYCLIGMLLAGSLNNMNLTRRIVTVLIGPLCLAVVLLVLMVLFPVIIIFTVIEDVCKLLRKD